MLDVVVDMDVARDAGLAQGGAEGLDLRIGIPGSPLANVP